MVNTTLKSKIRAFLASSVCDSTKHNGLVTIQVVKENANFGNKSFTFGHSKCQNYFMKLEALVFGAQTLGFNVYEIDP